MRQRVAYSLEEAKEYIAEAMKEGFTLDNITKREADGGFVLHLKSLKNQSDPERKSLKEAVASLDT